MVYLATDKQTYADLSITETANNEQFLFSLFSKTETKEGKALMLNWIMYPLSDLGEIRKRQEAIVWDALPELLLNEEELDFIEYYLAYRDQIREARILLPWRILSIIAADSFMSCGAPCGSSVAHSFRQCKR